MGYVLSIDPGADQGWAIWHAVPAPTWDGRGAWDFRKASTSTLVNCGLGDPPPGAFPERPMGVVIEKPEVYAERGQWKGDPNNLITLAIRVGRALERYGDHTTTLVLPKTWKGQLPKEVHHSRAAQRLAPVEQDRLRMCMGRVPAGKQHNTLDAVALGLWYLGRLGR